jgi:hypothetical protein
MCLPICEFFCLTPRTHTGTPVCVRGSVCGMSVTHQQFFLESHVHQIFSVQMHTHALLNKHHCHVYDDTTGDEVDNNGDCATGYDDDGDGDGR